MSAEKTTGMSHFPMQDWTELTCAAPSLHINSYHTSSCILLLCAEHTNTNVLGHNVSETGVYIEGVYYARVLYDCPRCERVCFSMSVWYFHAKAL